MDEVSVLTRFDCTNHLVLHNSHCRFVELLIKLFFMVFHSIATAFAELVQRSPTHKGAFFSLLPMKSLSHATSPALSTGFMLFPRLPPDTQFFLPALVTRSCLPMLANPDRFSRTCDLLHFFPAGFTHYLLSRAPTHQSFFRACHWVRVFSCQCLKPIAFSRAYLACVTCFPVLAIHLMLTWNSDWCITLTFCGCKVAIGSLINLGLVLTSQKKIALVYKHIQRG